MITTAGLEAIEVILADQPNMFHALARETLAALLELGRAVITDDPRQELETWYRALLKATDLMVVRRGDVPLTAEQTTRLLEDVPAGRGVRLEAPGLAADAEDEAPCTDHRWLPTERAQAIMFCAHCGAERLPDDPAELPGCPRCHGSGSRTVDAADYGTEPRVVRCECQAVDPVESRRAELEAARAVFLERNPDMVVTIEGDRLVARARTINPCACTAAITRTVEPLPGEDPRVFEVRQRNPGCTVELMGDHVVRTCSAFRTRGPE